MDTHRLAVLAALVAALGATPSPSPRPTSTPNPYRIIQFASPTLGGGPQGQIAITGGWAAVKRDGRAAVVCLSFKNEASVAATRVVFEFPVVGRGGTTLGELRLDRRGTFSPGVAIDGWDSLGGWQGGIGHRGYNDNCKVLTSDVAAYPLLSAHVATYRVLEVEYADGHVWTAPKNQ